MATQIIAHRGASHDAPENTLAALSLAWQQGADASEIDIRLSSDGHIIACHDPDTHRTTGVAGKIGELTLGHIKSLDAGSWKGAAWCGEKIPTLIEILEHLPAEKQLVIEIKGDATLLPPLEAVLQRFKHCQHQLVLIGFDVSTMHAAKQLWPHIPALLLFGFPRGTEPAMQRWDTHIEELIRCAKAVGADGLDLCYSQLDDLDWIGKVQQANLQTMVWTVDDEVAARHLAVAGIEGITTNRPGWIRHHLAQEIL